MTARFFRREISWDDYRSAVDLTPPPLFEGKPVDPPEAAYNIAPSQIVPIIRRAPEGEDVPYRSLQLAPAFWGLVPSWWNKPLSEKAFSTFNARAETAAESATFRGAFRHGRCLVPASGFYAWSGAGTPGSIPFAIAVRNTRWFCFAGLWSRVMIEGSEIDTFAILTTDPNDVVAGLSTSMPVILEQRHYLEWLDPSRPHVDRLFRPFPAAAMRAWPAHPAVGNVRNQGPGLLAED